MTMSEATNGMKKKHVMPRSDHTRFVVWMTINRQQIAGMTLAAATDLANKSLTLEKPVALYAMKRTCREMGIELKVERVARGTGEKALIKRALTERLVLVDKILDGHAEEIAELRKRIYTLETKGAREHNGTPTV